MTSAFLNVLYFIINIAFSVVLYTLWTRVLLLYFQTNRFNPLRQRIFELTAPICTPFHRKEKPIPLFLPRYDIGAFIAIFIISCLKFVTLGFFLWHKMIPLLWIITSALGSMIVIPADLLFYALLIFAIGTYFKPRPSLMPLFEIIESLTAPLIRMGRYIFPTRLSGIDFSPFIMMVALKALSLFVTTALPLLRV